MDFRTSREIQNERYNDCLTGLEHGFGGFTEIVVEAKTTKSRVALRLDQNFSHVVIYTGDQIPAPHQRPGFAVEPMTCAPDAFNHDGWGAKTLAPSAEMRGAYTMLAESWD